MKFNICAILFVKNCHTSDFRIDKNILESNKNVSIFSSYSIFEQLF